MSTTILIIEDEHAIAELLITILAEEGYEVVRAHNGREGLEYLEQAQPNLIISDIMMPLMDGEEFCHIVKQHPQYHTIPIIMMTAAYREIHRDRCDCEAFLRKPIAIDQLISIVEELVRS